MGLGGQGALTPPEEQDARASGDTIYHFKADIMAGADVPPPRVAESNYELHA
jgi:hypothetical protein